MSRPGAPSWCVEDELALLLAGTAERRRVAAGRIAELSAQADEARLLATLARQRILLLGGTRRVELAPDSVTDAFRRRIERTGEVAHRRAVAFSALTTRLTAILEADGIPAVALKGSALSEEVHGDAALREYRDIDVLVPAHTLARAAAHAGSLGWALQDADGGASPLHKVLVHPHGAPPLELHWRIHWYETHFAGELIERSAIVDGRRRLDPYDQLAALLLFYARDGFAGLRLVADLAAWWDRNRTPAALPALERRFSSHPPLAAAWRSALAVATEVAGLEVAPPAPRRRREALARRLANWDLRGDPDQIMANVTLIDGLLAPAGGQRAFLRRRMAVPGFARTSLRYGLALGCLRGGRRWSPLPQTAPR